MSPERVEWSGGEVKPPRPVDVVLSGGSHVDRVGFELRLKLRDRQARIFGHEQGGAAGNMWGGCGCSVEVPVGVARGSVRPRDVGLDDTDDVLARVRGAL